jgi:phage FluMu protein Com
MNLYRCKHCKKVVKRPSDKKWLKSYCSDTGQDVHLIKVGKEFAWHERKKDDTHSN